MALRVLDGNGAPVEPGATVYDFRGDHAVFCHVSRPPDPFLGTLAKVTVQRGGLRREFYARTFDLVVEVTE